MVKRLTASLHYYLTDTNLLSWPDSTWNKKDIDAFEDSIFLIAMFLNTYHTPKNDGKYASKYTLAVTPSYLYRRFGKDLDLLCCLW
jgi:hypothetical protein